MLVETRVNEAYSNVATSTDTLVFGNGITLTEMTFNRVGNDMVLRHSNGLDEVTIQNWFRPIGTAHYKLDKFVFSDGTVLDLAAIEARTQTQGSDQADNLSGTAGADKLRGAGGNDKLYGFGGDDQLYGDDGDDTVMGGNGMAVSGNDSLFGGNGRDALFGEDGNDALEGDAGDDQLDGGAGNDALNGGVGNDQLTGGSGNDRLLGGVGDDRYIFSGTWGDDVVHNVGGGSDWLFFSDLDRTRLSFKQDGNDLLISVIGDASRTVRIQDHFVGGEYAIAYVQPKGGNAISTAAIAQIIAAQNIPGGYETLQEGDAANNQLSGAATRDLLRGLGGSDTLFGGLGSDRLEGGEGADYLVGGYGNVTNTGDDVIIGGAGNDTLVGEDGNDRLEGELGNDVYMLARGAGIDVIRDFDGTVNNSDRVQFSNVKSTEVTAVQHSGSNLILRYAAGDQLTVENYFDSANSTGYRIERFIFSDGVTWTHAQIQAKAVKLAGMTLSGPKAIDPARLVGNTSVAMLDSQLDGMIQAMASMAPSSMGQLILSEASQQHLQTIFAVSSN